MRYDGWKSDTKDQYISKTRAALYMVVTYACGFIVGYLIK
jgi:hypothetical protein